MTRLNRYVTAVVAAGFLALASSAYAGECCTKAVEKAKAGQACAACVSHKCCKQAIEKASAEVKPCEKCTKKPS